MASLWAQSTALAFVASVHAIRARESSDARDCGYNQMNLKKGILVKSVFTSGTVTAILDIILFKL